jgi:D-arabinose 1-dehydrogenase-like Zn-dependent alcohol dehydrogenase
LGCDKVVAISRSRAKKMDAIKMGADHFIATEEDRDWPKNNARSLDLIVSTIADPKMPIQKYLRLLRINGQFIQVGAPEDAVPGFNMFALIGRGTKIGGSSIG